MKHQLAAWTNLIVIFLFFVITFLPVFGIPFVVMTVGVIIRVYSVGQWWWQPLIIWDLGVNVMTAGNAYNTISARTAYWSIQGCPVAQRMEVVIDKLFNIVLNQEDHCQKAWEWQVAAGINPRMEPFLFFHKECETQLL